MKTPQSYIAVEPLTHGVVCALFYFEHGDDVYGWWSGTRDKTRQCAYFWLEKFFAAHSRKLYATQGMDLYGGWAFVYRARQPTALDEPIRLDDPIVHDLDRIQGRFAEEWMFAADDPGIEAERFAYERLGLPVCPMNVRSRQLDKLNKTGPVWIHHTRGFNPVITEYLRHFWPLDYPSRLRTSVQ